MNPQSTAPVSSSGKNVRLLIGEGMVSRRLSVRAPDVVFVKGICEASEGLAQLFAESGGEITLASPTDREAELDELCADLCGELGAILRE